jgi:hypothetical protein
VTELRDGPTSPKVVRETTNKGSPPGIRTDAGYYCKAVVIKLWFANPLRVAMCFKRFAGRITRLADFVSIPTVFSPREMNSEIPCKGSDEGERRPTASETRKGYKSFYSYSALSRY